MLAAFPALLLVLLGRPGPEISRARANLKIEGPIVKLLIIIIIYYEQIYSVSYCNIRK
jgi:hypothetical protein